ncbi:hypothetical protein BYZ73_00475 [Rhodovulum viride]|uniref:Peptidase U49-like protein n=1 Tax=Rhodovulum viride TaxID=1231134 RepID=A0ABX9DNX4_9RHOB|nr:hypothetical protein [Rhodovulum viride]RAP43220.1 hypothetical protein BYZ73_00475 [Rhodovulum viride]
MSGFGKQALFGLHCERLERLLDRTFDLLHQLARHLEDAFDFPSGRTLEVRVSEEPVVNARACLEEGESRYGIEFTLGMIIWLDGVAATLAAHVARDFEEAPYPPLALDAGGDDWRAAFKHRLDLSSQHLPEDHHGAWESFFQKALLGIFAHEFFHIARGHLDWQRARYGAAEVNERSLRQTKAPIRSDEVRYLEFDADIFAARMVAHLAFDPPEFLIRWRVGTSTESLIETLLGLTLFFVSIEAEERTLGSRAPDYPRPLLRMIVMATFMSRSWSRANPSGDFWMEVFAGALSVLSLFEALYPEIDLLRTLLDSGENTKLMEEADRLSDFFDTLQPDIVEYAFDGAGLWPRDEDESLYIDPKS